MSDWQKILREHCSAQLKAATRSDLQVHSSLQLFSGVARLSGVEHWLDFEVRHPGKLLKIKLRAGALPLMVRVGVSNLVKERFMRRCVLCNSGAVESEEHFVADCPYYTDLRAGCVSRIRALVGQAAERQLRSLSFLQLVAGCGTRELSADVQLSAEKYLGLPEAGLAPARHCVWSQVTVPGSQWRLPAPR